MRKPQSMDTDSDVLSHYLRHGYELAEEHAIDDMPPGAPSPIKVVMLKSTEYQNDWLYATVGMGRTAMPTADGTSTTDTPWDRVELAIPAREPTSDLVRLLRDLAAYPFYARRPIGLGHTIARSPDAGVVQGSPLTDVLLAPPYFQPPSFQLIQHSDGTRTRVLMIVPIYPEELQYARDRGWKWLEERFREAQTSDTDWWRPSVVKAR